jgi:hypothetical protein
VIRRIVVHGQPRQNVSKIPTPPIPECHSEGLSYQIKQEAEVRKIVVQVSLGKKRDSIFKIN